MKTRKRKKLEASGWKVGTTREFFGLPEEGAAFEEIFREALALPVDARVELAERLIASLAGDKSPELSQAQLREVRRRIASVESGEVELIPGDKVLARVRKLLIDPR
jgi:putative addiction module component (TIGR02574 family)